MQVEQRQDMGAEQRLKPLPYPVYFVFKNIQKYPELVDGSMPPPVEQLNRRFSDARDSWTLQTYVQLKRRGLEVHLVSKYIPGVICVATYEDLAVKDFSFNSYVVICQQDRGRPEICEERLVQNQLNVLNHADHFLPLWSQPNLIPRDPDRGCKLEILSYKGRALNLAQPFKSPEFLAQLAALGVQLSTSAEDAAVRYEDWTDYSSTDAILAVRNCTEYNLSIKPASKLVNAWVAGSPALLGPEPAYQALRKSELDYIEVRSPEEVIAALKRLQENPGFYRAMIENGLQRAKDYTPDAIATYWRDVLAGPVAEGYERWMHQSAAWKLMGRPIQFAWRTMKHKQERQKFFTYIHEGPRLFAELPAE